MKPLSKHLAGLMAGLAIAASAPSAGVCQGRPAPDLLDRLRALPGATVREIQAPAPFRRAFEIWLRQPVDHDDPARGTFRQRVFLAHRDPAGIMVLETEGYAATWVRTKELARLLGANQLMVEHRYWGASVPEPRDWTHLTVEQSARDLHRIVGLLRPLYAGPWVSTGRSKGGMAALFHRAFFPEDVDATVAIAAPVMTSRQDPRFESFMQALGGPECQQRIAAFQRHLLQTRERVLPLLRQLALSRRLRFSVPTEILFEYVVVEYPFAFWQGSRFRCSEIPGPGAPAAVLLRHLDAVVSLRSYGAATMARDRALVVQALREIGYHGFRTDHLDGLLRVLPRPDYAIFAPAGSATAYDPATMARVVRYLERESERVLLLYGERDPWTACAAPVAPGGSNLRLVVPGVAHAFRLSQLPEEMKRRVEAAVGDWLQVPLAPRWPRGSPSTVTRH